MPFVNVAGQGQQDVNLFYQDIGTGHPIILVGGWPFPHDMWEYQLDFLTKQGYRCITYDRRGFGRSDRPATGYDYDTLTADLKALTDHLCLENFSLVGFSMGGGEVIRYCTNYGQDKVKNITLIGSIIPYLLKTDDNPDGVEQEVFDTMREKIMEDRADFLGPFTKQFFGVGLLSRPVSGAVLDMARMKCADSGITATLSCIDSFSTTDFRSEVTSVNVPVLIMHGTSDSNVAIDPSSRQAVKLLPNARLIEFDGEPHGLHLTKRDEINNALAAFCSTGDLQAVVTESYYEA